MTKQLNNLKYLTLLPGYFKVTPTEQGTIISIKYSKGFKPLKGYYKLIKFEDGYYYFEKI